MKKSMLAIAVMAVGLAMPGAAQAQVSALVPGEGFIGVSGGVHDLAFSPEVTAAVEGIEIDDSSPIAGVFAGYDFPIGPAMFIGAEGNYHFGTDVIDSEYGVSGRIGFGLVGARVYARAGYQVVDVDYNEIVNVSGFDFSEFDDTEGDVMVGLGADLALGGMFVRANVDTVSFDSMRATAGLGVKF